MKKRKIRLSAILLFLVMIILIPTTLSIYRETKTKTLGINLTHPNYNLTLDADGGSIPSTSGYTNSQDNKTATKVVTYGHEYGTLPTPVKEGYRFDGWNGKNLFNKEKYSKMEDYDITNNHTFYYATIQLKPNTNYKVSVKRYNEFNGMNNGYLLISTLTQNGTFNDSNNWSSIAHPNNPNGSPAGYSYTTDSTGNLYIGRYNVTQSNLDIIWENTDVMIEEGTTATSYEPYYVTSSTNVVQAKNHTLTAKYTPNTYSVVFDKNDNDATGTMSNQTFTYDTAQYLTPNAYTKTGYTFTGWNTQADGQGTAYLDGVSVNNLTTTNNEIITLYAQWIPTTYIVTLDANGGTIPTTSGWTNAQDNETSTKTLAYDSPYGTLPEPTREGYRFDGWNGKNLLDLSNSTLSYATLNNDNSITSNMNNMYYSSIYPDYLKEYFMNNLGKTFTFSMNECIDNRTMSIVVYGTRTSGATYQEIGSLLCDRKVSITLSDDFTSITRIELRFNRYGVRHTDIVTRTDFQLEEGSNATTYELYYVTSSVNVTQSNNHTLTAKWTKKEATFDTGENFNAKIKQLAGDTLNSTYPYLTNDTNITSIVRANSIPSSWIINDVVTPPSNNNIVSTNDSMYPIYAWYDNGTIYYYTEALNPYMNRDAGNMFRELSNVTSIDINTIDTSRTTFMHAMFYNCSQLINIDLSNFNTSNVGSTYSAAMAYMFSGCSSLTILDLSSFNTSKVTDMSYMFTGCSSLTSISFGNSFDTSKVTNMSYMFRNCPELLSIDLSKFDMSSVINVDYMLYYLPSLKSLKTPNTFPTDTSVTITLPTTLYDASGNSYSTLTSTSPTSTWLKLEYQPYSITYDLDGGSLSNTNPSTYNINSSSITLNNPTKTNYIFKGWSVGKNLFDKSKYLNSNDYTIHENPNYAGAEINLKPNTTYKISIKRYNNFSGTLDSTNKYLLFSDSGFINRNWSAIVHSTTPDYSFVNYLYTTTEDGKIYIGYSNLTQAELDTIWANTDVLLEEGDYATPYEPYISEQTTVTIPSGSSGNRTYKAIWGPNYYTITFDSNGGTGTMNDQIVGVGATATLNANTFTKTGKKFVGWNTRADGQGTAYLDQDSISSLGSATDTITLYAQWVQLMAEDIGYDGNAVNCNNVQCMIDELYNMLN